MGICCLCMGYAVRKIYWQHIINRVLLIFGVLFLVTIFLIMRAMIPKKEQDYRYLIVLGAHVAGTRITDSLKRRLDKAAEYARKKPQTVIIVSGGQGVGEDITEAQAMKDYLLSVNLPKDNIVKEDRSASTQENLEFSMKYIDDVGEKVGIVSNNFHVYRACTYAKKLGYQNVYPVASDCHPVLFVNYMIRECFALWKMWIFCRIK